MKKFLATIAATVTALVPSAALAGNNNIDEHQRLWDTLNRIGIQTLVNDRVYCNDDNTSGLYSPTQRTLVICQDNAKYNNGRMIAWTDNDLDTLRHEAHHVVQDCLKYGIGDNHLSVLFDGPGELHKFYSGVLSNRQVNWIIDTYRVNGADSEVIRLELEAFAVAASVSPISIANALEQQCGVRR
jgi:hypothetical protein